MEFGAAVLPAAAALLGGMYVDAHCRVRKDLSSLYTLLATVLTFKSKERQNQLHFYYRFQEKFKATPDRVFIVFEDKKYTYRQIEEASNRLARWLQDQGIKPGEVVCMMQQNHPMFFVSMYGIAKTGAIASLINTNLSESSLMHCLKVANTRLFLFDPIYEAQVATVAEEARAQGTQLFAFGDATEDSEFTFSLAPAVTPSVLQKYSADGLNEDILSKAKGTDAAILIYTSGTTGMPKAAIVTHQRVDVILWASTATSQISADDVIYCVLPLYHSSGLLISAGSALTAGATLVIGRKFSASKFWDDCVKYRVTVFHYIGELCRYLLNRPVHPLERKHRVRLIYGNGMQADVWRKMRDRFEIPDILEFYGATEGIGGFHNYNRGEYGLGSVGIYGPISRATYFRGARIIKIDPITEEPQRNKVGFCEECNYDEHGELVMAIDPKTPETFSGYYKNKEATSKKILRNVFKKGDMYFRTGDLFRLTSDGRYYFGDRLGDTFRWHGENVATTEVAKALNDFPGIAEVNAYGTPIPNHEGRAGMVAIVLQPDVESLDMEKVYDHLSKRLPRYAVPIFIRILTSMSTTGTFKLQKAGLRTEGIDPTKVKEPIFWQQGNTYVPFTQEDYGKLARGAVKL
ncbi:hypothetical protein VTP01DRAFT_4757 [Rhizomucor pusillus]|uniref:uncharacterized protein n=1 Tax=Rhizomucor pusillus TaxID=4840 RepID=UPI003743DE19